MKFIRLNLGILTLLVVSNCAKPDLTDANSSDINTDVINIPGGFDYSTYRTVKVRINDNASYVRYDVFAYSSEPYLVGSETFEDQNGDMVTEATYRNDILNKQVFSGVPKNGILEQSINLPTYYDKIYIRRNDNLNYSSSIESIVDNEVNYFHANGTADRSSENIVVTDYLYCVNGSGELFQVDPLSGVLTYLSDMPMGSWTCAIDQENKMLYSIGRSNPYPLMKYSIENNSWEIIANLGIGGPRLDFNTDDNLLYFSKNNKLYTFDPTNGANLNIWTINGLHNTNGGDLAFAEDGTLFLCTFSGLYRLEMNDNNEYDSTRISADNLPFQPTSMTFDSNQELWLANNASSSDLIIMDTVTGGWQYEYGINAENNTNFGRTINDLTTFRIFSEDTQEIDSDGDGILDRDDSYPEDAEKAFEIFTPSKYGTGTIAFEDLWPSDGDYDFNDMALNYQAIAILNSQNLVVQVDLVCNIKSNSAGYTNGVGIEIEGISPSQIESVNGTTYTESYISLNPNGTEANQENAVIILTDNPNNMLSETTVSIVFTEPITTETLGVAPFNPFIIANKIRANEIHLPYQNKTSLGQSYVQIEGQNYDPNGNYISDNGYPWGISIIHDFKVPKESIRIYHAYNFFNSWAESGGTEFKDWYKDNPGNRNQSMLKD
ncbi:LruC domain-containing protein [Psychroserpens sp.]|uniref:LruC domain-containing protein n=1 Tax=Psychroserpens sp. TaxID=2020870 RepID=UPI001B0E010C|nr:LruC domain-containing protein [Psychroserpens sp.]MBO6605719.1 LruC domain-containing protein [Psychroserpens sp.]MBO6630299.1 LruC domain-containing protein [Psychroserpens sp.]MBO6652910.1 LruC domain-containing protein [Psychroserpens sp.]MBO6681318.1 LruC domain-containing protein [Psychroserpens sp.]MBO6749093.1 LruC domain-containing protein [Psychroserpens sp.]